MELFVDWLVRISTTLYTYLAIGLFENEIAIYMSFAFCLLATLILITFALSLVPLLFKLISRILIGSVK